MHAWSRADTALDRYARHAAGGDVCAHLPASLRECSLQLLGPQDLPLQHLRALQLLSVFDVTPSLLACIAQLPALAELRVYGAAGGGEGAELLASTPAGFHALRACSLKWVTGRGPRG